MRKLSALFVLLAFMLVAVAPLAAQDSTATPDSGVMTADMAAMNATAEATAQPKPPTGHIRIAHLSVDTPPFDTYINGSLSAIQTISYPNITGWVELPVGTYQIAFVPVGQTIDKAILGPTTYTLAESSWMTMAVVGSYEARTLSASINVENYTGLPTSTARLTFFNGLPGSSPVVLTVRTSGGENFSLKPVQFGAAQTVDVPAGASGIKITTASTGEALSGSSAEATAEATPAAMSTEDSPTSALPLAEFGAQTLNAGTFYFLALTGTTAKPETLWNEVTSSQLTTFLPPLTGHIIDVAAADGRFTTLLHALDVAGLTATLKGDGPFTVFAPVDAAFAAEPNLNNLINQPDILRQILLYHVHSGVLTGQQVFSMSSIDTLEGSPLQITVNGQIGYVNGDAQIIIADIPATNGVIHAVNHVLMPPDLMAAAIEATAEATP